SQEVPPARAEVLQRAWQLGRDKGGYAIVLRAAAPLLTSIPPAGDLMWFAADAVRALLVAGRGDAALAWYALARREAASNPDAARAAAALGPLAALAGGVAGAEVDASFDQWWAAQPRGDAAAAATAAGRGQRVLALIEAAGMAVRDSSWAKVLAGAP